MFPSELVTVTMFAVTLTWRGLDGKAASISASVNFFDTLVLGIVWWWSVIKTRAYNLAQMRGGKSSPVLLGNVTVPTSPISRARICWAEQATYVVNPKPPFPAPKEDSSTRCVCTSNVSSSKHFFRGASWAVNKGKGVLFPDLITWMLLHLTHPFPLFCAPLACPSTKSHRPGYSQWLVETQASQANDCDRWR